MSDVPPWVTAIFERFPIKNVLDIGANRGDTIDLWLRAGAERVVALEPVPDLFDDLVARFGADARVRLMPQGLSDHPAVTDNLGLFNCWSLLPAGSSLLERSIELAGKTFSCTFTTLGNLLEGFSIVAPFETWESLQNPAADTVWRPDFIKIDVDGMEAKVLRGGDTYIREAQPLMLFEMSYLPRSYGDSCEEMVRHIFELGYKIELIHRPDGGPLGPDDRRTYRSAAEFLEIFPWHTSFDVLLVPWPKGEGT